MRVTELAKELGITSEVILNKLKSLRLKAKSEDQELNAAVLVVLRSELKKEIKTTSERGLKQVQQEPPVAKAETKEDEKSTKTAQKTTGTKTKKTAQSLVKCLMPRKKDLLTPVANLMV